MPAPLFDPAEKGGAVESLVPGRGEGGGLGRGDDDEGGGRGRSRATAGVRVGNLDDVVDQTPGRAALSEGPVSG